MKTKIKTLWCICVVLFTFSLTCFGKDSALTTFDKASLSEDVSSSEIDMITNW